MMYLLLLVGFLLLLKGADFFVDGSSSIARILRVPSIVIGLTIVAMGTSAPETAVSITAGLAGSSDISLGNIVGANLFNLVLVSGVSVTLSPFAIPCEKTIGGMNASLAVDIPLMIAVMAILTVPALIRGKLSRAQGILLLAIYAAFCVFQFAA